MPRPENRIAGTGKQVQEVNGMVDRSSRNTNPVKVFDGEAGQIGS